MPGLVLKGPEALDALLDWFGGGEDPLIHAATDLAQGREHNHLHTAAGIVYYGEVKAEIIRLRRAHIADLERYERVRRAMDEAFREKPAGPGEG